MDCIYACKHVCTCMDVCMHVPLLASIFVSMCVAGAARCNMMQCDVCLVTSTNMCTLMHTQIIAIGSKTAHVGVRAFFFAKRFRPGGLLMQLIWCCVLHKWGGLCEDFPFEASSRPCTTSFSSSSLVCKNRLLFSSTWRASSGQASFTSVLIASSLSLAAVDCHSIAAIAERPSSDL